MPDSDLTGLGELTALLGAGMEFEGKLFFEGKVRIDGKLKGQIEGDGTLVLGDGAEVEAEVKVATLIIRGGTLKGSARASQLVEIHQPGRMYGDIHTPQVAIDKGVVFEGECFMTQNQSGEEPQAEQKQELAGAAN